ncbi:MAG TPA: hypothetical protein VNJ53_01510 [Gaiellaceae bacterium]|nr:hypothetical protein [Gaiellaceae bacterium]
MKTFDWSDDSLVEASPPARRTASQAARIGQRNFTTACVQRSIRQAPGRLGRHQRQGTL